MCERVWTGVWENMRGECLTTQRPRNNTLSLFLSHSAALLFKSQEKPLREAATL